MKNLKNFMEYIDSQEYGYEIKRGKILACERLELWETAISRTIDTWDKALLIKLCIEGVELNPLCYQVVSGAEKKIVSLSHSICKGGYFGLNNKIGYINDVLDFLDRDDLKLKITDLQDHLKDKSDDLFTKDEIIDICDALANVQDKFIVYALFSGIRGNKYGDLVNLKTKDVNFDNKTVTLPSGKIIVMDEYLEDVLRDLTGEFGNLYFKLNKNGNYTINDYYEFNEYSEYLVKVRPTKSNNNGLGCMSFQGLQTRLQSLSKVTELPIKGLNIYRSGVIHKMRETKVEWKQNEIDTFIKENQFGLTPYEIQRAYNDKYVKTGN